MDGYLSVGSEEEHGRGQNDKPHRDSGCPAPEPEGNGSTEYWSVETLPQTGHVPQVEDFLPS
jgi:hypothetical protein